MKSLADTVSAADANRQFSELLRRVRGGRSVVVTSHGRPVAKLVPIEARDQTGANARRVLLDRLQAQPPADVGRWSRAELYEE